MGIITLIFYHTIIIIVRADINAIVRTLVTLQYTVIIELSYHIYYLQQF